MRNDQQTFRNNCKRTRTPKLAYKMELYRKLSIKCKRNGDATRYCTDTVIKYNLDIVDRQKSYQLNMRCEIFGTMTLMNAYHSLESIINMKINDSFMRLNIQSKNHIKELLAILRSYKVIRV